MMPRRSGYFRRIFCTAPVGREQLPVCDCEATILGAGSTNKAVKRGIFQRESGWDLRARAFPTWAPRSAWYPSRRSATKESSTPSILAPLLLHSPKVQCALGIAFLFFLFSYDICLGALHWYDISWTRIILVSTLYFHTLTFSEVLRYRGEANWPTCGAKRRGILIFSRPFQLPPGVRVHHLPGRRHQGHPGLRTT